MTTARRANDAVRAVDPLRLQIAPSGGVIVEPYANDCRDSIGGRRSLICMVNPDAGRELERRETPAPGRRVVVVGGGGRIA